MVKRYQLLLISFLLLSGGVAQTTTWRSAGRGNDDFDGVILTAENVGCGRKVYWMGAIGRKRQVLNHLPMQVVNGNAKWLV